MKNYQEILNEGKTITIYHGDNYKTTKLSPKLMMQESSNAQEGIGIYFGTLEVASNYGKNIVSLDVDKSTFINSRDLVVDNKYLFSNVFKICKELNKIDPESMFYLISSYVMVSEVEDVTDYHIKEFGNAVKTDEIRNFQITMAQSFGVENFVKVWNKILPKNNGTIDKSMDIYAVINPKLKIKKYKDF